MSTINTFCDEVYWGEVFPGYGLVQATNNLSTERFYTPPNGVEMRDGRFGITRVNDPFVVFSADALRDPTYGSEDPVKTLDTLNSGGRALMEAFMSRAKLFHEELRGDFGDMGAFYEALRKDGYRPSVHGYAGLYVCHHVADFIEKNKFKQHQVYEAVGRRS